MKIELDYQSTPALWRATDASTADGAEDSGTLAHMSGMGKTREEALIDLLEQLDEYWRGEVDAAELRARNQLGLFEMRLPAPPKIQPPPPVTELSDLRPAGRLRCLQCEGTGWVSEPQPNDFPASVSQDAAPQ